MNRKKLEKRGAMRLRERHLWPSQFRAGRRSVRIEWERVQKMFALLPLAEIPEYAQHWIWLLERTTPADILWYLARGDFPYFDAWAHRLHVFDEVLLELGFGLPARTPVVYASYVIAGLAQAAQQVFRDAGGPARFGSAYAEAALTAPARTGAPPGGDGATARPRGRGSRPRSTAR